MTVHAQRSRRAQCLCVRARVFHMHGMPHPTSISNFEPPLVIHTTRSIDPLPIYTENGVSNSNSTAQVRCRPFCIPIAVNLLCLLDASCSPYLSGTGASLFFLGSIDNLWKSFVFKCPLCAFVLILDFIDSGAHLLRSCVFKCPRSPNLSALCPLDTCDAHDDACEDTWTLSRLSPSTSALVLMSSLSDPYSDSTSCDCDSDSPNCTELQVNQPLLVSALFIPSRTARSFKSPSLCSCERCYFLLKLFDDVKCCSELLSSVDNRALFLPECCARE